MFTLFVMFARVLFWYLLVVCLWACVIAVVIGCCGHVPIGWLGLVCLAFCGFDYWLVCFVTSVCFEFRFLSCCLFVYLYVNSVVHFYLLC